MIKMVSLIILLFGVLLAVNMSSNSMNENGEVPEDVAKSNNNNTEIGEVGLEIENVKDVKEIPEKIETATFAGGCFWCIESAFEHYEGVKDVISGYTGGEEKDPTYKQVSSGETGHYEAVRFTYDANTINYTDLLEIFIRQIDPTDPDGSFVDRGPQYRSAIFYHTEEQKQLAEAFLKEKDESGLYDKPIVTKILPAGDFYDAEEYHQDYYKENPAKYTFYRYGSGRDQYIDSFWGEHKKFEVKEKKVEVEEEEEEMASDKDMDFENFVKPGEEEIKEMLTDLQFKVTQKDGTEKPFENEYWDNKEEGIYVDLLSGEPLFSSTDKYTSGTGWPSFTKPIDESFIVEKIDLSLFMKRTEVRSKYGDNHIGHVFNDGPDPTGLRYCMNSAGMKFIPKEDMEKEGYGDYLSLFE